MTPEELIEEMKKLDEDIAAKPEEQHSFIVCIEGTN